ncbi:hypothetical protein [Rhizobium leguminosarum]|uniref:hypothetical protein n=1 Tax=Rhizobium leguminosarum TaxID=384 RepID=UPI003F9CF520
MPNQINDTAVPDDAPQEDVSYLHAQRPDAAGDDVRFQAFTVTTSMTGMKARWRPAAADVIAVISLPLRQGKLLYRSYRSK